MSSRRWEERSVAARFEQQVRRGPRRLAVMTRQAAATYDELNRAANRLARAILARRPSPAEPVAVLCRDDVCMITAILAALKAGKPYVPLDPAYPQPRIRGLLDDAQATLVCCDHGSVGLAREVAHDGRVAFNVLAHVDAALPDENLDVDVPPESVAYILYTSGSTGRPKGVVQSHESVLQITRRHTEALRIERDDRIVLLAARAAAQAAHGLFSALLNGAALYPFRVRDDGLRCLAGWLREHRITIYHSSASLFRYFAAQLEEGARFPDLRVVKLGSEPVVASDVQRFRMHFSPPCVLVNALSASETGSVAQHVVDHQTPLDGPLVPVGVPLRDVEISLVDESDHPVAPGTVGEILVTSRSLASGYWRQPEATAAAFSPARSGEDGDRTYRTGDLGYRRPDGCLVHVGRRDAQVKIRGQRVQLPEIEAILLGLDSVTEAVVVARADTRGEQRLVAYVVTTSPPHALRTALRELVPEHMVPPVFMTLPALPRTPNGKVDRSALPPVRRSETPAAPRTPLEARLAEIWGRVLGVEHVGVSDDFFESGGHSLLAAHLLAEIEVAVGCALPLSTLVEAPTIAQLAAAIEHMPAWSPLVAIQPTGHRRPFFCVHGGLGNVLGLVPMVHYLGAEQPFYALQAVGVDGQRAPLESIEEMAALYVDEVRRVQPRGPYSLGGMCVGGVIAFEMAQQLRARGEDVALLVAFDTLHPPGAPVYPPWTAKGFWVKTVQRVLRRDAGAHFRYSNAVYQATERARRRYRPSHYDGTITFIRLGRPDDVPVRQRRWQRLAGGGLAVHVVPGHHGDVMRAALPHVARTLKECLRNVAANEGAR